MKTISFGLLTLPVLLSLSGCNSAPSSTSAPAPAPATAPTPLVQPDAAQAEAIKKYDDKLKKDIAAKRRQRNNSDADTTHAYRNYVP